MERGRCLGVEGALMHGQEDIRYPLGVAEPLQVLVEEFQHSENHTRKVMEIGSSGYAHRRRVRGDGNCFYRAACFAWLEALVARAGRGEAVDMPLPGGWPEASLFGALAEEYRYLRSAVDRLRQNSRVGQELLVRLLHDARLDLCMVALLRLVTAEFLAQFATPSPKSGGGDSFGQLLRAAIAEKVEEHGSIERYVRAEVLPLGREAEGAGIYAAAVQLGVRMRILQLDGQEGPLREYVYPCEDYEGPLGIRIHLLFRPGHYELLYSNEAGPFTWGAPLRGRCSFCHEEAELKADGLLACFHRLCLSCSLQASRCPNCVEFLPTSAFAPTLPNVLGGLQEAARTPAAAGQRPAPRAQELESTGPPPTLSPSAAAAACDAARARLAAAAAEAPGQPAGPPSMPLAPAPAEPAPAQAERQQPAQPPVSAPVPQEAPAAPAAPAARRELAAVESLESAADAPAPAPAPAPAAPEPGAGAASQQPPSAEEASDDAIELRLCCHEEIPQAHGDAVTAITAAGGRRLYTASLDGSLLRWRLSASAPGSRRCALHAEDFRLSPGGPCFSLAWCGEWLYCGLGDGRICGFSESGAEVVLRGLAGHTRRVVALLACEHLLFSGGEDGSVRCWQQQGGLPSFARDPCTSEELKDGITCFAMLGVGLWVGTAAGLAVLELGAGGAGQAASSSSQAGGSGASDPAPRPPPRRLGPCAPVSALARLGEGRAVAAAYEDGGVQTYSPDGALEHALRLPEALPGDIRCAAWASLLGPHLLLGHASGELSACLLENRGLGSPRCRRVAWRAPSDKGSAVACLSVAGELGAEVFALGTADGRLQLWGAPFQAEAVGGP